MAREPQNKTTEQLAAEAVKSGKVKVKRYRAESADKARSKTITASQVKAADEARTRQAAEAREDNFRANRAPKLGKKKIQPAMSWDDWNELGAMGRVRARGDDEVYDGGPVDSGPEAVRAMQAYIATGGPNKKRFLPNEHHLSKMDDFTAGHSQRRAHFRELEDVHSANRRIKDAAKAFDDQSQRARKLGDGPNDFTVVSVSQQAATVNRAYMEAAVELFPVSKGVKRQDLSRNLTEDEINSFAISFKSKSALPLFRDRVLDDKNRPQTPGEDDHNKKRYKGVIGIACTPETRAAAAQWAAKQSHEFIIAPFRDQPFMKMVASNAKGGNHPRYAMLWSSRQEPHNALASFIDGVDSVVTFTNDPYNKNSPVTELIAEAERHGKNTKILDQDGKVHKSLDVGIAAMQQFPSFKEKMRQEQLSIFDVPMGSPESRFAISRVRTEKGAEIAQQDINKLAGSELTLSDVVEISSTHQGRESLRDQYRTSPAALRAFSDEDLMAKATTAFDKGMTELREFETDLGGIEDLPEEAIRNGETFFFIKGSKEAFRDAKATVFFVGEPISGDDDDARTARNIVASKNAPLISEAVKQNLTIVTVAGETSVAPPVTPKQVIVLPGGHGHSYGAEEDKRINEVIRAGGAVVSMLPPETKSTYYDPATKLDVFVSSAPDKLSRARAISFAVNMSEQTVVQNFDAKARSSSTQDAVQKSLEKAVSNKSADTRPIVVDFTSHRGVKAVSGNRALLSGDAAKGMKQANLATATIEKLASQFEGASAVIGSGPDAAKAAKNLAELRNGGTPDLPVRPVAARGREL